MEHCLRWLPRAGPYCVCFPTVVKAVDLHPRDFLSIVIFFLTAGLERFMIEISRFL